MSMATRWAVAEEHDVGPADRTGDGAIAPEAVGRWLEHAWRSYLAGCVVLEAARTAGGFELRLTPSRVDGPIPAAPRVLVSASATEVFPRSFVLAARLRTFGGDDDRALNATCEVYLLDPVEESVQEIARPVRDELIAIEQRAGYVN